MRTRFRNVSTCGLLLLGLLFTQRALATPYTYTSIDFPGATRTEARGINNLGQVVGTYGAPAGAWGAQAFLLSEGSYTALPVPNSLGSTAEGINDSGEIVGSYIIQESLEHEQYGFLLSGGSFTQIGAPTLPISVTPSDINDSGQVVGWYLQDSPLLFRAIRWTDGSYSILEPPGTRPPGPVDPYDTFAYGINDAGDIVGESFGPFGSFLLSAGVYTELDVVGTPSDINNLGHIVGNYSTGGGCCLVSHGFLLIGGSSFTIDFPGATQTSTAGMNDLGQIVGQYRAADGTVHGFVATPVPEPSTLALCALGTLGLACRGRIRGRRAQTKRG